MSRRLIALAALGSLALAACGDKSLETRVGTPIVRINDQPPSNPHYSFEPRDVAADESNVAYWEERLIPTVDDTISNEEPTIYRIIMPDLQAPRVEVSQTANETALDLPNGKDDDENGFVDDRVDYHIIANFGFHDRAGHNGIAMALSDLAREFVRDGVEMDARVFLYGVTQDYELLAFVPFNEGIGMTDPRLTNLIFDYMARSQDEVPALDVFLDPVPALRNVMEGEGAIYNGFDLEADSPYLAGDNRVQIHPRADARQAYFIFTNWTDYDVPAQEVLDSIGANNDAIFFFTNTGETIQERFPQTNFNEQPVWVPGSPSFVLYDHQDSPLQQAAYNATWAAMTHAFGAQFGLEDTVRRRLLDE